MDTTLCILVCVITLNTINAQLGTFPVLVFISRESDINFVSVIAIERHQIPDINFYTSLLFDDVRDQLIIGAR